MLKLEQSKAEFAEELNIAKSKLKLQEDEFDLDKEAKDRELFNTTKSSLSSLALTNISTTGCRILYKLYTTSYGQEVTLKWMERLLLYQDIIVEKELVIYLNI